MFDRFKESILYFMVTLIIGINEYEQYLRMTVLLLLGIGDVLSITHRSNVEPQLFNDSNKQKKKSSLI